MAMAEAWNVRRGSYLKGAKQNETKNQLGVQVADEEWGSDSQQKRPPSLEETVTDKMEFPDMSEVREKNQADEKAIYCSSSSSIIIFQL